MKAAGALLSTLLFPLALGAGEPADLLNFERLETFFGKVCEQARATRVLIDEAVVVSHSSGVAPVAAADLPDAIRAATPFDHPGAEARAAAAAALRARRPRE